MNRRQRLASASAEKKQLRKGIKRLDRSPKVNRLRISGAKLREIPTRERVLFVTFGRLLNELAALSKIAWWCGQHCEGKAFDDPARLSQSFSMLLLYIGKLFEGWEFLCSGYFSDPIGRTYETLLDDEAKASLRELKRYFRDGQNKLKRTRNLFGFHYNVEATERALETLPADRAVEVYFGHHHANSFYQVSEATPRSTPEKRPMLDARKAANGKRPGRLVFMTGETAACQ